MVFNQTGLSEYKASGSVGLSPTGHNGVKNLLDLMKEDPSNTYEPIFSMYLSATEYRNGEIMFGGYDVEKYGR